jgi:hypothetical protein
MVTNSCNYKLIHASEIGAIELCNSCSNLKVEIGSLLALISRKSFEMILKDFQQRRTHYFENLCEDQAPEQIIICLNNQNLFLNLSPYQFDELIDLFEMSSHMLEVDEILDFSI